jgi:hypothetical protein
MDVWRTNIWRHLRFWLDQAHPRLDQVPLWLDQAPPWSEQLKWFDWSRAGDPPS